MCRRLYTSVEVREMILEFCREIGILVVYIKPLHSTLKVLDPDTNYNFAYGIDIQMPYSKLSLLNNYNNRKTIGYVIKVEVRENFNVFFVKVGEEMTNWSLSQPVECHYRPM